MIKETADRDVVATYVRAVRERLEQGAHDSDAETAARRLGLDVGAGHDAARLFASELGADNVLEETEPEGEEPFISRDPLVSLVQTSLATALHRRGIAAETPVAHPHHGLFSHLWETVREFIEKGKLTARGAELAGEVAEGVLLRLAEGTHAFNETPAEHELADDNVRLIVVGDWGSGVKHAGAVAKLMSQEVDTGLDMGRAVHVIHLGDVYFAGEPEEYRDHVLAPDWWPVTREQAAAGVGSWALAGNHDLYGGARAYFTVMLADPRFEQQRSNGQPTSWFRLTSPSWEIIGIDTSWNNDPFERGQTGLLQDPQAAKIAEWVAADEPGDAPRPRKRLILSHHQLMTVYDTRLTSLLNQGKKPVLHEKMGPIIDTGDITAWIWGHEHRCMSFEDPANKIAFPRCLGHGGQLQQAHAPGTRPPAPGIWEETAQFEDVGGAWGSFGFAVLDLDGAYIDVSYHLDGAQPVVATERVG